MLEKAIRPPDGNHIPMFNNPRFADDMVILIDSHAQHEAVKAVEKRLREELVKLKVEKNEEEEQNRGSGKTEEASLSWALNIAAFWAITTLGYFPASRHDIWNGT
jgi:hypothetical protein